MWAWKFLYPERKSWGFKNIRIRVDGVLAIAVRKNTGSIYLYSLAEGLWIVGQSAFIVQGGSFLSHQHGDFLVGH